MKKIFATAAVVLALAGCSGQEAAPGDDIKEYVYQYNGHDLHCVGRSVGWDTGVLSCDFVRYHAENAGTNG